MEIAKVVMLLLRIAVQFFFDNSINKSCTSFPDFTVSSSHLWRSLVLSFNTVLWWYCGGFNPPHPILLAVSVSIV